MKSKEGVVMDEEYINELFEIIEELDARNRSYNCVNTELIKNSWIELCEKGIALFEKLK